MRLAYRRINLRRRRAAITEGAERLDFLAEPCPPGKRGRVAFEPFARDARQAARALCGAVSSGGEDPFASPLPAASVLVIGSEGSGLPAGAYRYLDRRFTIPMRPPVDSLNAAVAAALVLYSSRLAAASSSPNTSA